MCEPNSTARPVSSKVVRSMVSSGAPSGSPSRSASCGGGRAGADGLAGAVQGDPGGAHQPVEAGGLQLPRCPARSSPAGQVVAQVRHRLAVRQPQPLDQRAPRLPSATASAAATSAEAGSTVLTQHPGGGALARRLQVVVEAAQLQGALDLAVHDLGADAAAAHQQALVDERLDGLADGGAGQAEPRGQLDLVAQQAAGGQLAAARSPPRAAGTAGSTAGPDCCGPR